MVYIFYITHMLYIVYMWCLLFYTQKIDKRTARAVESNNAH